MLVSEQPDIAMESNVAKSDNNVPGKINIGNCNRFIESKEDPYSRRSQEGNWANRNEQGEILIYNRENPRTDNAYKGRDIENKEY